MRLSERFKHMDVIVRPDRLINKERHGLRPVKERSAIFAEQYGGAINSERVNVSLNRVGTPIWVCPRSRGPFFSIEWDSQIVSAFGKEAQRHIASTHPWLTSPNILASSPMILSTSESISASARGSSGT